MVGTYHSLPLACQILKKRLGVAKDAFFAGGLEGASNTRVVAPGYGPDVLEVPHQQVTRPADLAFRPRLQPGAAKPVDEDDVRPILARS